MPSSWVSLTQPQTYHRGGHFFNYFLGLLTLQRKLRLMVCQRNPLSSVRQIGTVVSLLNQAYKPNGHVNIKSP